MRINKKERVDVKRYMEEMKANRTNRSYTSVQMRNRQNSEEGFQDKHLTSKHSLYGGENDYSRQRNQPPQGLRYNLDSNMGNMRNVQPIQPIPAMQPIYASYMPPMALNDFSMTQQSQVYASPPSYPQHNGMMNYSQTYNPHVPSYQPMHQDSRYEFSYPGESSFGMAPPQANRPNKIQEENTRSPKREATFTNFMKNDENVTKKKDQFEEKRAETVEKIEVECAKKKSLSLEVDKTAQADPAKQKKKKRQYKKRETKELAQKEDLSADEKDKADEEDNTLNISRKFDEILQLEKKKIEKRLNQDAKLKDILSSFNDKISAIADNYFSAQILTNLSAFERKMAQFAKERLASVDDRFTEKLLHFESAILRQLIS